jgi:DNA-binding response OmpR family regulator
LRHATILMIEDDARLASMVSDHLRPSGLEVTHAGDGAAGISLLKRSPMDLICST